jgi:hypothetical protein
VGISLSLPGEREHENHDPGLEAEPTKEVEMEDIAADPEGTGMARNRIYHVLSHHYSASF